VTQLLGNLEVNVFKENLVMFLRNIIYIVPRPVLFSAGPGNEATCIQI